MASRDPRGFWGAFVFAAFLDNLRVNVLMPQSVVTINMEIGHATVEEARQVLKAELEKCRNRKVIAVKIIHGYGSSRVGGAFS